eukprot:15443931-Alexandrium_andersonii.AAC.1
MRPVLASSPSSRRNNTPLTSIKYPPVSAGSTLMSTIRSSPVPSSRNGGRVRFNAYDRPLTSVRTGV